jgi:thioredoxin 1
MPFTSISYEQLKQVNSTHEKMMVVYTSPTCETCIKLFPEFKTEAENKRYAGIAFYEVNAQDYPAAMQVVNGTDTPFVTICENGYLINSRTVTSLGDFKALLADLLVYSH